ncbi:uncharacterized protein Tco025E_05787 [Trypanosoma conorhini]|uniref:Uncharacterized protein n=1 Tax=Trypanosoma conorhini TaxID=83891 RepID=A0A422PAG3_9TRYP|nr:uncharacterized protein Tco025E_05787 [Trypanosoma conorhini]RNF14706.1 hypothetical protein Tco025E_05787 [Trypanosoma conorhini]
MSTEVAGGASSLLAATLELPPVNGEVDGEETKSVEVEELRQEPVEEVEVVDFLEEEEEQRQHPTPWERLYEEGLKREARRQEVFEKATAHRVARALFDQQCLTAGRGSTHSWKKDFAERQQRWLEEKEERVRQLRELAEVAELRRLQPPAINEVSQHMAARAGHEGPIRGWEAHYARYAIRFAGNPSIPTQMFRPNINLNARHSGESDVDIGERLYSEDMERRRRLHELTIMYRQNELIDSCTGKPYFTPSSPWKAEAARTRRGEARARSAAKAAEMLYTKAQEQRERRGKLVERTHDEHSFAPEICRLSRKMAERRKKRENRQEEVAPQPSAPRERMSRLKLEMFLSREEACLARRRQKLEEAERQRLEKQQEECTFVPRINKRSVEIFEGSQQRYSSLSPPLETTRLDAVGATPPAEDAEMSGGEHLLNAVMSPLPYDNSSASASFLSNLGSDGSQLISEFEHKMKELLNEWRSLERV